MNFERKLYNHTNPPGGLRREKEEDMKRDIRYRTKSLKQLIDGYAHEVGRINQQDKEATQAAIVNEIYARVKDTFDMIDANPSAADQIYKQLIEH